MAQGPKGDSSGPGTSKQRQSARLGSAARLRYVRTCPCGRLILCVGGTLVCVWVGVRPSVSVSQSVSPSINQSINQSVFDSRF